MDDNYPINVYADCYNEFMIKVHQTVDQLAELGKWDELLQYIDENGTNQVNCCKLPNREENQPPSLFTPLHYAAEGIAPYDVIKNLIEMGAAKSLKNKDGKTAYDIGVEKGLSTDKLDLLSIPDNIKGKADEIQRMEEGLHKVINERIGDLIQKNGQALPQLSLLYEKGNFYYPVPGMYGGYSVSEHEEGIQADSWIRVCGGSEQNHLIYKDGSYKLLPNDNPL